MSVNNIPGSTPALVRPSDFLPKSVKPSDFQTLPQTPAAPEGLTTRVSADAGMPPRTGLPGGPNGPKDAPGNDKAKDKVDDPGKDTRDALERMEKMNNAQMEFQTAMGIMKMKSGVNEAEAKMKKDIGQKAAQMAG